MIERSTQQREQATTLVVGLGRTGLSCVRHLRALGRRVAAVDSRVSPPELAAVSEESPEVRVTLTDTVGVAGASLFYNAGAGWIEVSPTVQIPDRIGDDYSWQVPVQTPNTWVALQLRAWDAAGNALTYELWPAYVQAPYRHWLPLALKDAAP